MKAGSVSKRYAMALLQVAQQEGKVSQYLDELETLVRGLGGQPQAQAFLDSPVVKLAQKKAVFKALQAKLNFSPTLLSLLYVLLDNDRAFALPMVLRIYQEMADDILGQVRVKVTSAAPLGGQEEKLKALLQQRLKQKILLETKVDPELVGGLVIQVKDGVFDGSLRRELTKVKEAIAQRAVA